jgi:hypothetical protein
MDYFSQRYGRTIRDRNQPLLRATVKNRDKSTTVALLIPELCLISGWVYKYEFIK